MRRSIYGVSSAKALLRRTNENGEAGFPTSPLSDRLKTRYGQSPADLYVAMNWLHTASVCPVKAVWHCWATVAPAEVASAVQQATAAVQPPVAVAVEVAVLVAVAVEVPVLALPAQSPAALALVSVEAQLASAAPTSAD